ncbi:MAG: helix-turn-helix domain-containing protein [Euryarchaeota archaeon]|nr:helix-turn-helix domain-containing protein [Euryarchaeota archaeon]
MAVTLSGVEETFERLVREIGGEVVATREPGRCMRRLREDAGITQEELARLMKLRRESISRIENGSVNPTLDYLRRFARVMAALKIVRELLAREEASLLAGQRSDFSPRLLRLCPNFPVEELGQISELGFKSYQRTKKKVLRRVR